MKPDAIIVRAGRLEQGMWAAPLVRLGAGFAQLRADPVPYNGDSHVGLSLEGRGWEHVHASTLYVVLVDSEEA